MNYFSKNENAILNNESFHKDRQSEKNSFLSVKISKEKNLWAKLFLFLKNFFALVCKTCNRFARRAVTRCHRRHRHRPTPHRPPAAPPPQLPKGAAAAEPQQAERAGRQNRRPPPLKHPQRPPLQRSSSAGRPAGSRQQAAHAQPPTATSASGAADHLSAAVPLLQRAAAATPDEQQRNQGRQQAHQARTMTAGSRPEASSTRHRFRAVPRHYGSAPDDQTTAVKSRAPHSGGSSTRAACNVNHLWQLPAERPGGLFVRSNLRSYRAAVRTAKK